MGEKTFHVSVTSSSQGINVKPESGGQSINTTVSVTSQKNININAATKQNPIGATSDTGLYYSQLSKNWAIGDGLIQNEDYSSKTWAAESKTSADLSKMYSEAASLDYNNLSETINQYNEQISGVVAEGVDSINTTVTEALEDLETASGEIMETVEANSRALPMFSPIWSDHLYNDASYLRADTFSWHAGYIYKTAYEVLLNEYNNENCIEEVENGITYRRTPSGFKIANADQNDVILDVYNRLGIAWYYILDIAGQSFKLPRTKYGFTGVRDNAGGNVDAGLPSLSLGTTGAHTHTRGTMDITGTLFGGANGKNPNTGAFTATTSTIGKGWNNEQEQCVKANFKASNTWTGATSSNGAHTHTISDNAGVLGNSDTVQPPATQMYLYFYVGNYVRPQSEINTGKTLDALANKADIDGGNYIGSGLEERIDNTLDEFLANTKESFLNKSQITNCLLEVPQRIKLELVDGVAILKAGSEVIVPNGANVFDYIKIESDLSFNYSGTGTTDISLLYNFTSNVLGYALASTSVSGTTAPTDSRLYYDTANNIIDYYNNGKPNNIKYALPIAILSRSGGTVTGIKQIFNGRGYIGSIVWVDKDVKGLIPNGRNEDGSCKNKEFTTNKLQTYSFSDNEERYIVITKGFVLSSISKPRTFFVTEADKPKTLASTGYSFCYTTDTNLIYWSQGSTTANWKLIAENGGTGAIIGTANFNSGVITSFNPKQPFRAVDYNDFADRHCTTKATTISSATSLNPAVVIQNYVSGTSWYRVWSDGWIEQGGRVSLAHDGSTTISLLVSFTNTNASAVVSNYHNGTHDTNYMNGVSCYFTSKSQLKISHLSQATNYSWQACGY